MTEPIKFFITGDSSGLTGATHQAQKGMESLAGTARISAGQTAQAFRQLPAQFTDIATQLAGGQSVGLVLLQQGGQIKDAFGGIGPAVSALGSLITPFRLAVTGLAAPVVAFAAAMTVGRFEADALTKSIRLTGGYAGVSADNFSAAARAIQASAGVSIGASRDLLAAATATGAFGVQSIGPIGDALAKLQSLSGASTDDVVADFARMAKGVSAWAVEHNRQYAFLTKAEYEQIHALELHGKTEQAMALVAQKLSGVLAERKPELGTLQRLWKSLGDEASEAWEKMKGLGRPETIGDKISQLADRIRVARQTIADAKASRFTQLGIGQKERELAQDEDAHAYLQEQQRMARRAADRKTERANDERAKIDGIAAAKALGDAQVSLELQLADNRVNAVKYGLQELNDTNEVLHKAGLVELNQYIAEKQRLERSQLAQEGVGLAAKLAAERKRSTDGSPAQQLIKQQRIKAVEGDVVVNRAKQDNAPLREELEFLAAVAASEKAVRDENVSRNNERVASAQTVARDLTAANRDTAVAMIKDERTRVEAQISIEREAALARIAPLKDLPAEYAKALEAVNTAVLLKQRALEDQLKPAWRTLLESWQDTTKLMTDAVNNGVGNALQGAEDAFVHLVQTGKLSVKDLVNSMLADFARAQFRSAVGSIFGAFLGGPGALLKGATGFGDYNSSALLAGARAGGGPVNAGSTYLVGERGPELLRMGAMGGGITPNSALMGGGTSITLAPVIKIDARSDQGQIAQLVGAAMQQTQRSMWEQMRVRGLI